MIKLRVSATGLAVALALCGCQSELRSTPKPKIQVLLQGEDPALLENAIIDVGGEITHHLPIIGGIGGIIDANQFEVISQAEGVQRAIDDANPPSDAPERDCWLGGSLEVQLENSSLSWRVFNFSDADVSLSQIEAAWPEALDSLLSIEVNGSDANIERSDTPYSSALSLPLPPGASTVTFNFERAVSAVNQSDFDLTLKSEQCDVELVPAYPDNHNDFYYSRVLEADRLHQAGITGSGVTVAIVDSGLWEAEPLSMNTEGKPRIPARFDAITNKEPEEMSDESGHGTHMTSVLAHNAHAGSGRDGSFKGVAPDVNVIPVKVFDAAGSGDFLDIIRGVQWVVEHREKYDIRIMNMSLAAQPRFYYWDDPINQAVLQAWRAGITVIVAAGNEGPDWSTVGSPGNNPYVITVGAVTDSWTPVSRTDDYIPDFSSRGPTFAGHIKPDIVAPGGHMTGVIPSDSMLARENPNYFLIDGSYVSTGSSQAAAAVSGVAALLLQIDPSLSNDDIKCALTTSAEPAINRDGRLAYSPFEQGHGYISAVRAVTLGERGCGNLNMDIDSAAMGEEQLSGPAIFRDDLPPTLPELEHLMSDHPSEKGESEDRRWGVKAHVERLDYENGEETQASDVLENWAAKYKREQEAIQSIQR